MADKKLIVSQDKITAVADAIREKTSTTDTMTLDEMPEKISSISGSSGSYTKPKLPDPIWYLDYENNKLYIYKDPYTYMFSGTTNANMWLTLTDNDVEIPWSSFSRYPINNNGTGNMTSTNTSKSVELTGATNYNNPNKVYIGGETYNSGIYSNGNYANETANNCSRAIYDIPLVKGRHIFKIKYNAYKVTTDESFKLKYRHNSALNKIGPSTLSATDNMADASINVTENPFTDSNVITLPEYTINEYKLDLSNIKYDSPVTGLLPAVASLSSKLYTYEKSIIYTFDATKSGNNITSSSSNYIEPSIQGDDIVSSWSYNNWNETSYIKIKFTLAETQNVSINYKFYMNSTSNKSYDGIWFGALDKDLSITTSAYNSTSGITNAVYSAGYGSSMDKRITTTKDNTIYTYTYENVSAGEHYIQLRFFNYYPSSSYSTEYAITPVYEKTDTGYYLPSTITVTDADTNEAITDYTYDPYTGDFDIPMTHSWNMTAVASTLKNILDKVSYNMNYNTGIMTLSSTGATSYTYNIDDGEETTTTGDIDLTSLSDKAVHTITSMAEADDSRPSGKNSYKVYKNMSDTMAINDIGFNGESTANDDIVSANTGTYYRFSFSYNDEIYKVYSRYVSSESKTYYYFYRWPDNSTPAFTVHSVADTAVYSATIDVFTGDISNVTTSTSFTLQSLSCFMQINNYLVIFGDDNSSYNSAGYGYFYILDMTTHKWVAKYKTKYKIKLLSVDDEYLTLTGSKDGSNSYYIITSKLGISIDSSGNTILSMTPMNTSSTTFATGFISIRATNGRNDIRTSDMTAITYNKGTNDYNILAIKTNPDSSANYRDMFYLKNVQLNDFNSDTTTVHSTFKINEDVFALTKKHLLIRDTTNSKIKIYEYAENTSGDGVDMTKIGETTYTTGYGMATNNRNAVYYTSELSSSFSNHIFTAYITAGNKDVYFFY